MYVSLHDQKGDDVTINIAIGTDSPNDPPKFVIMYAPDRGGAATFYANSLNDSDTIPTLSKAAKVLGLDPNIIANWGDYLGECVAFVQRMSIYEPVR